LFDDLAVIYTIIAVLGIDGRRKYSSNRVFKPPQKPKLKDSHTYLQFEGYLKVNELWFKVSIYKTVVF
jgi:hypothetical protein